MAGELKKIVEKYRGMGFRDSDIMAVCHIRESHLYLIDDGREGGIPSIPYREIISCDLAFERRAKLYMKAKEREVLNDQQARMKEMEGNHE